MCLFTVSCFLCKIRSKDLAPGVSRDQAGAHFDCALLKPEDTAVEVPDTLPSGWQQGVPLCSRHLHPCSLPGGGIEPTMSPSTAVPGTLSAGYPSEPGMAAAPVLSAC